MDLSCLFKLFVDALIFFNQKLKGFNWLYIDYKSPNNLTIKNRYLLPLIKKLLGKLTRVR